MFFVKKWIFDFLATLCHLSFRVTSFDCLKKKSLVRFSCISMNLNMKAKSGRFEASKERLGDALRLYHLGDRYETIVVILQRKLLDDSFDMSSYQDLQHFVECEMSRMGFHKKTAGGFQSVSTKFSKTNSRQLVDDLAFHEEAFHIFESFKQLHRKYQQDLSNCHKE